MWWNILQQTYDRFTTNLRQTYDKTVTDYCDRLLWQTITRQTYNKLHKLFYNIFTTDLQQTYDRQWQTIVTNYCERYVMKYFTTNLRQTIVQTVTNSDKLLWKICDEIFYDKLVDCEDVKINLTCLFYCYV